MWPCACNVCAYVCASKNPVQQAVQHYFGKARQWRLKMNIQQAVQHYNGQDMVLKTRVKHLSKQCPNSQNISNNSQKQTQNLECITFWTLFVVRETQNDATVIQNSTQGGPRAPEWPQRVPKSYPKGPQRSPKGPKAPKIDPKMTLKWCQRGPRRTSGILKVKTF